MTDKGHKFYQEDSLTGKIKTKIEELEKSLDRKPFNKKTIEVLKGLLD